PGMREGPKGNLRRCLASTAHPVGDRETLMSHEPFGRLEELFNSFAHQMKLIEDRELGWVYEETATLGVDFGGGVRKEFYAEIHREPVMGFGPKSERITIRLCCTDLDDLPRVPKSEETWTLYRGDVLFGTEGGWRWVDTFYHGNQPWRMDFIL